MYDEFNDRAGIFVVYIAEAHSVDGWQTASNESEGIRVRQHTSLDERRTAAQLCTERLALSIPMLIDEMDDAAGRAFSAWPERIYILDGDGSILYQGGHGPYDFRPEEARQSLVEILSDRLRPGEPIVR